MPGSPSTSPILQCRPNLLPLFKAIELKNKKNMHLNSLKIDTSSNDDLTLFGDFTKSTEDRMSQSPKKFEFLKCEKFQSLPCFPVLPKPPSARDVV